VEQGLVDGQRQYVAHLEWERLAQTQSRLAHAATLLESATVAEAELGEGDASLGSRLAAVVQRLKQAAAHDAALDDVVAHIDLVIGEQSAPEIMQAWSKLAGVSSSRLLMDPARYASVLSAAPLIALHDAVKGGRLHKGMTALLLAGGSGPVWAAACVRWGGAGIGEW